MYRLRSFLATLILGGALAGCDLKFQEATSIIINEPPIQLTRDPLIKSHPAWSPDGSKIAYSALQRSTSLLSFSLEGALPQTIGRVQDEIGGGKFALSPDGSRLAYRSLKRQNLWIVDLVSGTEVILTPQHPSAQHPAWSKDGQRIAFSAPSGSGQWHIWTIPTQGGAATEVTQTSGQDFHPSWSPDGRRIVFESREGSFGIIKVFDLDSVRTIALTPDTLDSRAPDWSPDGARIAFSSTQETDAKIFTIPADSGAVVEISTNSAPASNPAWSSNGTRIAYQTPGGIWVSSLEGVLLNQTSIQDVHPVWVPNQTSLVQKELMESSIIEVFMLSDSTRVPVTQFEDLQKDSQPAWFPDSKTLAFTRRTEGENIRQVIWTIRFPDGQPLPLIGDASPVSIESNPAVSPNGDWLVFDDTQRLFLLPLAGGEPVDLSPFIGSGLTEPSWSPFSDGFVCRTSSSLRIFTTDSSLVIEEMRIAGRFNNPSWATPDPVFGATLAAQGSGGIFLISLERSTQEIIVSGGNHPNWSPDGKFLTFTRDNQVFILPILFSL